MTKPSRKEAAEQVASRVAAYAESRTHAAGAERENLVRAVATAPTDAVLDIAFEDGRPVRFRDEKLTLRADR